jgi:hypothetical protein
MDKINNSPTHSDGCHDKRRKERLEKMRKCSKEIYGKKKTEILEKRKDYYVKNNAEILEKRKDYYVKNNAEILEKNREHYRKNSEDIRKKQAKYYAKMKKLIAQRKRFHKQFDKKDALSYLTPAQVHLYHHTNGFCQPESIYNHCIESYDGHCEFCSENDAVKILGVNRLVCLSCNKAQCVLCKTEVSSDPCLGPLHYYTSYYSDTGCLLRSLPDYCPLYSKVSSNSKCRICEDIKVRYPEYDIFRESVTESKKTFLMYVCNLCPAQYSFVCQFDQHMRSHTKYGKNIAILALKTPLNPFFFQPTNHDTKLEDHIEEKHFASVEKEILKVNGVSAVLAVFNKRRLKEYFNQDDFQADNLGASLLLKSGADIKAELTAVSFDKKIIESFTVLTVRNHYKDWWGDDWRRTGQDCKNQEFEKLLLWREDRFPPAGEQN